MASIGRPIAEVNTPALLVDYDRLTANIQRYAAIVKQAGVRLRPHIKTHKIPEVAALQLAAGAGGITAAKLSEAEVFADAGVQDIFVAYPVVGWEKATRAAQLAERCRLCVGVESVIGIQQLAEASAKAGTTLSVRVEIDSGLQRTGVSPENAEALCRLVMDSSHLRLDGIFTFRSTSFPNAQSRDPAVLGKQEGELMVALAEQLRAGGVPIHEISVGSTPTSPSAALVPGVTEVRPGTYVFFDRMMIKAGICTPEEVALSILATVISRPAPDIAVIDAGSKTFCGDIIPANAGLEGYGATLDSRSGIVERMNEEHGIVQLAAGYDPQIGDKIAFFPNHVCTTVNLSDEVVVVKNGTVQDSWTVAARGKRQ